MAGELAQNIERQDEAPTKSEVLNNVLTINRMREFRQEIGLIADSSVKKRIISDQSYSEYRKVAMGQEDHELTLKLLESMRDFAQRHESKADRVHTHIERAIKAKVASEKDEEFLMSKLILGNEFKFVQDSAAIETLILQKIANMEKDKEAYDKIANHPLARNVGYLKVDEHTKIDIPDEKKFLEMTVPERRAFLKKAEEAIPKAEEYAEKTGKVESLELFGKYKGMLDDAKAKKIIGQKTYEKFLDGFKKIDQKEKKYWIQEFPNQMARYETLWKNIRSTLKGQALNHIESLRDQKGYTELFTAFGNSCEQENKRLDASYKISLQSFKQKGYIGNHTINEFRNWMQNQDLQTKYNAVEQLNDGPGGQMERYRKLYDNIQNNLSPKAQNYMASKIDEWGYTEMNTQYQKFMRGEKVPSDAGRSSATTDPLSIITSGTTRAAIVQANLDLKKRGTDKRDSFLNRVTKMFVNERRDNFDASGFQSRLRNDREESETKQTDQVTQQENTSADVIDLQERLRQSRAKESRRQNEDADRTGIEDEMKTLEKTKKAHAVDQDGFRQVEMKKDDHTHRKAQVEINRERAMDRFFIEDHKNKYRSTLEGGHDDLSLAVKTQDGRTVELNLEEIRAMQRYMEQEKLLEKD
ncbi:hypothetical protein KJ742_03385 [Patescibacteria group bacterium]|nr:hypothetical protein [Patescibacteria group bacterium]MBU1682963.1 hypothetical protein [Patescibacteria group bacterium]MBU1934875.1 hypothetical protein [Patescibacteria group bacterium]